MRWNACGSSVCSTDSDLSMTFSRLLPYMKKKHIAFRLSVIMANKIFVIKTTDISSALLNINIPVGQNIDNWQHPLPNNLKTNFDPEQILKLSGEN